VCHLSAEFRKNRSSSFCEILLTNKQTPIKHNLFGGGCCIYIVQVDDDDDDDDDDASVHHFYNHFSLT